jgi:GT2 family glycosyltransferase
MKPSTLNADVAVGIVVIGRNEGARLIACLKSLASRRENTIYVDSGSTDGSMDVAEEMGFVVRSLDLSKPFTAARARNFGLAILRQLKPELQFVQFVDGDCIIQQTWIENAIAFLQNRPDVAVVVGRRREIYPEKSIYNRMCDVEWATPPGQIAACGGDSLMRISALQAVEGFRDDMLAGEEPELCIRLQERGWKIWRLDSEMTLHDAAIYHMSQWWQRCKRSGYGNLRLSAMHRRSNYAPAKKELVSIAIHAALIPAIALLGFWQPVFFGVIALYPIQMARIAVRRGAGAKESWEYGFLIIMSKFPLFLGMLAFAWDAIRGRKRSIIEYK